MVDLLNVTGTNLGGNSTILMLLYLSWSSVATYGNHLAENRILLQQIWATFLNVEQLIKEHKIQVDSEIREVRKKSHMGRNRTRRVMPTTETWNHSSYKQSDLSGLDLPWLATELYLSCVTDSARIVTSA